MPYDFTTLIDKVCADAKRPSYRDKAAEAVLAAEEEMNRIGRFSEMVERTTLTSSDRSADDDRIYTLPDDFIDVRRVRLGASRKKLLSIGLNRIDQIASANLSHYAVISKREIQFNKAPADDAVISLMYFARLPSLSDTTPTNRVLENQSALYINLALAEMYKFTEDLELAQAVANTAVAAIDELNRQASRTLGRGSNEEGPYNFTTASAQ